VVKGYWCVCIQTESAHCFFEKRGLHINVYYYLFIFVTSKSLAEKLDLLDWQNMEKIIASTDRQDRPTDCDTNLKVIRNYELRASAQAVHWF
jgi:hypothetical protein